MKKMYSITLLAIDNGDKQIVDNVRIADDEDAAISAYFQFEKMRNDLKAKIDSSIEVVVLFDVFCHDSECNAIARYEFYSKIQAIKDKRRLSFNNNIIMILW